MKSLDRRLGDLERRIPKPTDGDEVLVYLPANGRDDRPPGRYGNVVIYDPAAEAAKALEVATILEACGALDHDPRGALIREALAEARGQQGDCLQGPAEAAGRVERPVPLPPD